MARVPDGVRRAARDHERHALAAGLERAVSDAEHPSQAVGAAVPVRRVEVLEAREPLLALAAGLRADPDPPRRGLALTRRLLCDARGPLYTPTERGLGQAVEEALAALGDEQRRG